MKGRLRRGHSAVIIGRCSLYAYLIGRGCAFPFMSFFAEHVRKSAVVIVSVSI
jgi:hypothetical protein